MPDIKISDLTLATAASGSMQLEVNDALSSKKVTVDQLKAYVIPAASITDTQLATGAVTLTTKVTGILPVANGGTGSATGGGFATGTRMSFQQTSAPTGWTKDTTAAINDSALRFVTGAVVNGGSEAFSTAFGSKAVSGSVSVTVGAGSLAVGAGTFAVAATTLSTAQMPSHTHTAHMQVNSAGSYAPGSYGSQAYFTDGNTGAQGGGGSHTHALSGAPSISGAPAVTSQTFTGTAINLAVKYYDFIIASKD
jgi:microcystin-dependent protein